MLTKFESSVPCQEGQDVVVSGNDDRESPYLHLKIITTSTVVTTDITPDELAVLRDSIDEMLDDIDERRICPACGQARDMAMSTSDHSTCRAFPYWQMERAKQPKTKAREGV